MTQRPIKFRAWDTVDKEIVYNVVVSSFDWVKGSQGGTHKTLMQFTGLHDKNGKEIWEGDIVQVRAFDGDEYKGEEECFVAYEDDIGCFCFFSRNGKAAGQEMRGLTVRDLWRRYKAYSLEFEVIGNIYENPELLKQ